MYIENLGLPRTTQPDQAKNRVEKFCNKENFAIFEAHVNDHRSIGFLEKLIQTNENRPARIKKICYKFEQHKTRENILIHQMRI